MTATLRLRAPMSLALTLLLAGTSHAQTAVPTQHNDNARTGSYTGELSLTPQNVNATNFGKLFTLSLDANVNGQVLYAPGIPVNGSVHNVIYAYTSNNSNGSPCSLYAFDADNGAQLWRHQFTNSAQWTTCAPAIDLSTYIIYVVTKDNNDSGATYVRALDIRTGAEMVGSPIVVAASVPGTGDGAVNGRVSFNTHQANCRPGVLLVNRTVYIGFAHNTDSFPYQGWVLGYRYDRGRFSQTAVFCVNPNGGDDGVWMAGKGITADAAGNIYFSVGNGTFTANTGGADYGMCYVKLATPALTVADWFAPHDQKPLSDADLDLGNSGVVGIPGTNRIFGGATKFGSGFLMDSTNMGHFTPGGPDQVLDRIDNLTPNNSVGQNPVAWDGGAYKYVYLWARGANLEQLRYDPAPGNFNPLGVYKQRSGTSGGELALSSNAQSNGILWAVGYDAVIHAFNAADVSAPELWNSQTNAARDSLGSVGHFEFPTVANSRLYVATGNAKVAVYGILPAAQTALSPIADSMVRAGTNANTNYGASPLLVSDKASADSASNVNSAFYMKFDLTQVTAAPTRAVLNLTVMASSNPAGQLQQLQAFSVADTSWTSSGITWNNAPALNRTNFTATGRGITSRSVQLLASTVSLDLTAYVRANIGKVITVQLMDAAVQNNSLEFASQEAASGRPVLVLTK